MSTMTITMSSSRTQKPARRTIAPILPWRSWRAVNLGAFGSKFPALFMPDGTTLVFAGNDGTIFVWDLGDEDSEPRALADKHTQVCTEILLSPDGKTLASSAHDQFVRLFDTQTWKCRHAFDTRPGVALDDKHRSASRNIKEFDDRDTGGIIMHPALSWTPDSAFIVASSIDNTASAWNATDGSLRHTFHGHSHSVNSVSVTGDGSMVMTSGRDNTVKTFDMATGERIRGWRYENPSGLSCQPNDVRVLFTGDRKMSYVNAGRNTIIREISGCFTIRGPTFSPDGSRMIWQRRGRPGEAGFAVVADAQHAEELYSLPLGENSGQPETFNEAIVVCSKNWTTAVSWTSNDYAEDGRSLQFWDLESGQPTLKIQLPLRFMSNAGTSSRVALSVDGTKFAAYLAEERRTVVQVWDIATLVSEMTLQSSGAAVYGVAVTDDGRSIATGGRDQVIKIWDTSSGTCKHTLEGHSAAIMSLDFISSRTKDVQTLQLVAGDWSGVVRVWNATSGVSEHAWAGHTAGVHQVRGSPNGKYVASMSVDGTAKLWNISTGELVRKWQICEGQVTDGVFDRSTDERIALAFASNDTSVYIGLYDQSDSGMRGWELRREQHPVGVNCIAMAHDGTRIMTGSKDNNVRLGGDGDGIFNNHRYKILKGHSAWVSKVAFSPSKTKYIAASGSGDGSVCIWDAEAGRCKYVLNGHTSGITDLKFSGNGSKLFSSSYDGTIRMWKVTTGELENIFESDGPIHTLSASADPGSSILVAASRKGFVKVYDTSGIQ